MTKRKVGDPTLWDFICDVWDRALKKIDESVGCFFFVLISAALWMSICILVTMTALFPPCLFECKVDRIVEYAEICNQSELYTSDECQRLAMIEVFGCSDIEGSE